MGKKLQEGAENAIKDILKVDDVTQKATKNIDKDLIAIRKKEVGKY